MKISYFKGTQIFNKIFENVGTSQSLVTMTIAYATLVSRCNSSPVLGRFVRSLAATMRGLREPVGIRGALYGLY